jgi:alcohol dehydrogenase
MRYYLPTKIILGRLENEIGEEVKRFRPRRILLITDGQAMRKTGVIDKLLRLLKGYQVLIFEEIKPSPDFETVAKAKIDSDLIIGLGGGSVLDVAKAVATELKLPYIAVPTTAGTGSEVTPFAALYDWKKKKKLSLDVNFPNVAIVDYRLTLTLPPELVASTGIDVLSQAIESYWSIYSNPLSDVHAKRAIELVRDNLRDSWSGIERAREAMSLAALESGLAFSQTKTTACHSVSYPLTIHYGIPHGLACGLTLPHFLEYNYHVSGEDCLDKRGVDFVKKRIEEVASFLGTESVEAGKETIRNLMRNINLPTQIDFDVEMVVKDAFAPERVANNPRRVTEANLRKILEIIQK